MITKTARNKIKRIVGKEYSQQVEAILKEKNLTNRLGNPYSIDHIRFVFSGVRKNSDIENAIYELVKRKKTEKAKRESILNL